jgi:2-polyprenyl-6-methoxyphenol hydroxylase-like FAD-dependent oxidoreductase
MKVIIIGAGIGGLTLAIALQQQGIAYEIYDAAPGNKAVGAGIMLGTNAMKVYGRLGLSATLEGRGSLPDRYSIRDHKRNILKVIDNKMLLERYNHASLLIHRAALQDELIHAVQADIYWGKKCVEVAERGAQVTVRFEDGSTASGDILAGADGIRSTVREQCVVKAQYRYSGQTCWRAIVPIDLPPAEQRETAEVWGNGNGLRSSYGQVGPQQVYFWMTKQMPAGSAFSPEAALDYIKTSLHSFEGYMQTVLKHLSADTLIHSDLYDIKPIERWYQGRVVLLGDAAHATTPNLGQGASQAIEDAHMLARCLASYPDHSRAFATYQQKRKRRAVKIVGMSKSLSMLTNLKCRIAVWFRNQLMKRIPAVLADQQMAFLYDVNLDR